MSFQKTDEATRAAKAVAYYMQRGTPFTVSAVQRRARTRKVFSLLQLEWKAGRLSGTIAETDRSGRTESIFRPLARR